MSSSLLRRSAEAALAAGVAVALTWSCAHVRPAEPLPADWRELAGTPVPFAALYRLECCRLTNLLAAIRSDGASLRATVAAPPGGTVVDAWLVAGRGWLTRTGGRCVEALPPDTLPLAGGHTLPLDVEVAGFVLSGRVPEQATPVEGAPGWVSWRDGPFELSWQIAGSPPRCVAFAMRPEAGGDVTVRGTLAEHHGRVPGRVTVDVGGERVSLELEEWRPGASLAAPGWLDAPPCGERP